MLVSAPTSCCSLFDSYVVLSGVDPSPDQWQGILKVVKEKGFLPFFDSAYQVRLRNPEPLKCQCFQVSHMCLRKYI